jgi:predicted N-acetyltransferase YhbS
MNKPTIRLATQGDVPALAAMIRELGYLVEDAEVAPRLPLLAGDGRRVLVAEIEGAVVGCLTTSMMQVLHRPAPVGRISMMVVAEGLRGRGIGEALVREAEALLRADGCYMVEVTSQFMRTDAHRFYERLGYEKTSVRLAREIG